MIKASHSGCDASKEPMNPRLSRIPLLLMHHDPSDIGSLLFSVTFTFIFFFKLNIYAECVFLKLHNSWIFPVIQVK